jgi:hypothetical protein
MTISSGSMEERPVIREPVPDRFSHLPQYRTATGRFSADKVMRDS